MYHFVTCDGHATGRASYYFLDKAKAEAVLSEKQAKAQQLGLATNYSIAAVSEVPEALSKEIKK